MAITITINGQVIHYITNSPTLEDAVGERSTFSFQLWELDQNKRYTKGMPVTVTKDSETIFTGFIERAKAEKVAREGGGTFSILWTIECIDNHYLADKRIVAIAAENEYAGDIVVEIAETYLEEEGIQRVRKRWSDYSGMTWRGVNNELE